MIKSASQSSLTNDVKYRNMGAANVPSNEYLIETVVVPAGGASSVVFNNINQYSEIYRHFKIVMATTKSATDFERLLFNGDTGNTASHLIEPSPGGGVSSFNSVTKNWVINGVNLGYYAATPATAKVIEILDVFSPKHKVAMTLGGGATESLGFVSAVWASTATPTSISLLPTTSTGNWLEGSRFSLYGVTI